MKKMSFKEVGMPTIILFVICLVVAAALAVTNQLTKDKIASNALETEIAARQAVMNGTEYELVSEEGGVAVYAVLVPMDQYSVEGSHPEISATDLSFTDISASDTVVSDSLYMSATDTEGNSVTVRVWTGISSDGTAPEVSVTDLSATDLSGTDISAADLSYTDIPAPAIPEGDKYIIGYVVTSGSRGFGGTVDIMIGVDLDLKITGVRILSHGETPGFGANCEDPDWLAQFEGMSGTLAVDKDGGDVDSLSSSTITSRAVTAAINKALSAVTEIEGRMTAE